MLKIGDFEPMSRYVSERVQDRDIVTNLAETHMRSIEWFLFPMTLSDPNYPQTTQFSTFCVAFHIVVVGSRDRDFKFGRQVDRSKC